MGVPAGLADRMSTAEQHEYLRSRLSRRGLLRGGAVTVSAPADTTAGTDGAMVAPIGRHLAFGAEPDSQIRISWQVRALHTPALTPTGTPVGHQGFDPASQQAISTLSTFRTAPSRHGRHNRRTRRSPSRPSATRASARTRSATTT
ncbi:hypothetical protein GCM10023235_19650 [Kitasatospora terrestris]|uniref:Uncharacterized protein n=2 Tax=Kitasatospora terrestris TaxID=258051 RepID=A0ABP9DFD7_9ACTN